MTRRVRFTSLLAAGLFAAIGAARAADVPFTFAGSPGTVPPFFRADQAHADIDGDGDLDVVVGDLYSDEVRWLENTDGLGTWTFRFISTASNGPQGVTTADLDRDGDADVVVTSLFDGTIAWYENAAGTGVTWLRRTVSTDAPNGFSVAAADLDRDGDLDLAYATGLNSSTQASAWFQNMGAGAAWTKHPLSAATKPAVIQPADMDGDGDLDLLSTRFWQENLGDAAAWTTHTIPGAAVYNARLSIAADVDGDGDLDVVGDALPTNNRLAWFENLDGAATAWTTHLLPETGSPFHADVADIDGDGDADVLVTSGNYYGRDLAWLENTGQGASWTRRLVSGAPPSGNALEVADVDGDGDPDLTGTGSGTLFGWWRNVSIHQDACFVPRPIATADAAAFVFPPADLDGDGDLDLVSAWSTLDWHENVAGDGSFWQRRTIGISTQRAQAADLDRDGDLDVASVDGTAAFTNVRWYENGNGGQAFAEHAVASLLNGLATPPISEPALQVADVSGDGDLDLVASNYLLAGVHWFENAGGDASAWTSAQVPGVGRASGLLAADLDGDADRDVATQSGAFGPGFTWTENVDGTGAAWSNHPIEPLGGSPSLVAAADVDRDGDADVVTSLVSLFANPSPAWRENTGPGSAWPAHTIPGVSRLALTADLDRDGDLDVAGTSASAQIVWVENVSGDGGTWASHPAGPAPSASFVTELVTGDLDRDGDPDLLSAVIVPGSLTWYENRGGQVRLDVVDQAPATTGNGALVSMLRATATHLGRAGDGAAEIASFALLFEQSPGVPLSSTQANALVESLRVYRDANDNGVFEPATDVLVTSVATLALTGGIATVALPDGDANAQVALGAPRSYFVVAEITATASGQTPNQFRVTLLQTGASRSVVEDRTFDLPLRLACPADVSSTVRQVVPVELSGFTVE